ncbi:hypothetical protein So717_29270 [Roseobacter cerasinus]|uniref:Uncharacterized protein n=1 Tax=Roseobacter cerasinus TaxID=2602289 RepID=A0A640VUA0_9RHOB|nr:hypothetical protein So717_29270 [Roseobacter cerasinus]
MQIKGVSTEIEVLVTPRVLAECGIKSPPKPATTGAIAHNEAVNASRAIWVASSGDPSRDICFANTLPVSRWSGDHRRSRVETKMHCVKLLRQRLMARDVEGGSPKSKSASLFFNRCTAPGIPATRAVV